LQILLVLFSGVNFSIKKKLSIHSWSSKSQKLGLEYEVENSARIQDTLWLDPPTPPSLLEYSSYDTCHISRRNHPKSSQEEVHLQLVTLMVLHSTLDVGPAGNFCSSVSLVLFSETPVSV